MRAGAMSVDPIFALFKRAYVTEATSDSYSVNIVPNTKHLSHVQINHEIQAFAIQVFVQLYSRGTLMSYIVWYGNMC